MARCGARMVLAVGAGAALACAHVKPYYEATEVCPIKPDPGRVRPASLIVDAEDGLNQVAVHGDRDGYLYVYLDDATEMMRSPGDQASATHPILGGADGSRCALNIRGQLADRLHAFAGIGLNMTDPLAPYDASRYAGISFKARRSHDSAIRIVVKFPDWNTEPPAVCTECFNHFHREVVIGEKWTQYTVLFDALEQYPEWGAPRPEKVDASRLYGIRFEVNSSGQPFDIWIDDVAFVEKAAGKK